MTKMTLSNHFNDKESDKSDVLSLLVTIDQLYKVSCNVLNNHTQTSLRIAIAIEAQMLQTKLQAMGRRWRLHLPFKEACQVDFYDWAKRIQEISLDMKSSEHDNARRRFDIYCPSKHFLLDLYAMLPESQDEKAGKPYYVETDISVFVKVQDEMKALVADNWQEYVRRVSDQTIEDICAREQVELDLSYDADVVCSVCCKALDILSEELYGLNSRLTSQIRSDEFIRLADRILQENEYGGRWSMLKAKAYVNTWKNETPYDEIQSERDKKVKEMQEQIRNTKYGGTFLQNVHLNDDIDRQKSRLGKFLFSVRKTITKDEVLELFELIFRIYYLRQVTEEDTDETGTPVLPTADNPQMENPKLPEFFIQDFRGSGEAVALFFRLLREAGPYICRQHKAGQDENAKMKRFGKWKWLHLKDALIKSRLMVSDVSQSDFSVFINSVFPDRSSKSVYRSLYRLDSTSSPSIVADIVEYFRPVKEYIKKS